MRVFTIFALIFHRKSSLAPMFLTTGNGNSVTKLKDLKGLKIASWECKKTGNTWGMFFFVCKKYMRKQLKTVSRCGLKKFKHIWKKIKDWVEFEIDSICMRWSYIILRLFYGFSYIYSTRSFMCRVFIFMSLVHAMKSFTAYH